MKLEEALPLYREGRTIISRDGDNYSNRDVDGGMLIECAEEREMMGEWTVKEEPKQPRKMAQAIVRGSHEGVFVSNTLFSSEAEAIKTYNGNHISWPACDGEGNPLWVLVPEVKG